MMKTAQVQAGVVAPVTQNARQLQQKTHAFLGKSRWSKASRRSYDTSNTVAVSMRQVLQCQAASTSETPITSNSKSLPTSTSWELDFCSRPILDERGKKVWELLICDAERNFEYAEFFPNNKINSAELKRALQNVLSQPGAVKPEKVRFFRAQMQTIITRALKDLDIVPIPSRRCFSLTSWLEERLEQVYKPDPGYSDKAATLFTFELGAPEELPDALRGETWSFVQLPLGALQKELAPVEAGKAFGGSVDLRIVGLGDISADTLIPGVAVYSRRAEPLAGWMNGLELAAVVADTDRAFLILETEVNKRWRYGGYRRTLETSAEAQAWEEAKQKVK